MYSRKGKARARDDELAVEDDPSPRKRARAPVDSDDYVPAEGADDSEEEQEEGCPEPDAGDAEDDSEEEYGALANTHQQSNVATSSRRALTGAGSAQRNPKRQPRKPERSGDNLQAFRASFPVPALPPLNAPPPPPRPSLSDGFDEQRYAQALYDWIAADLFKSLALPLDLAVSRRRLGLRSATASVQLLSASPWAPPPIHAVFEAASLAAAAAALHAIYYRAYATPTDRYERVASSFSSSVSHMLAARGVRDTEGERAMARVSELSAALRSARAAGLEPESVWAQYAGMAVDSTPASRVAEDYAQASAKGSFLLRLLDAGLKAGDGPQALQPKPTAIRTLTPQTPLVETLQDEYHLEQLVPPAAKANSVAGGDRPKHRMTGRALPLRVARTLTSAFQLVPRNPIKVIVLRSADAFGSLPDKLAQAVRHAIGDDAYPIVFEQRQTAPQHPYYARLAQGRLFGTPRYADASFSTYAHAHSSQRTISQEEVEYIDAATRAARAEVLWAVRCAVDDAAPNDGSALSATAFSDDPVQHLALCEALLQAAEEGSEVVAEVECWDLDKRDRRVVVGSVGEGSVRKAMEEVLPLPYPLRQYKREVSPAKVLQVTFRDQAVVRIVFGLTTNISQHITAAIEGVAVAAAIEALSPVVAKEAYRQISTPLPTTGALASPADKPRVDAIKSLVLTIAHIRIDEALWLAGTLSYAVLGSNTISTFLTRKESVSFVWPQKDSLFLSALPLTAPLAEACAASALVVEVAKDEEGACLRIHASADERHARSWPFARLVNWDETAGLVLMLAHEGHGTALEAARAQVKREPWLALTRMPLRIRSGKRVLVDLLSDQPTRCGVFLDMSDKMITIEIGFDNELLSTATQNISARWTNPVAFSPSPTAGRLTLPKCIFSRANELVKLLKQGKVEGDLRWSDRGGLSFKARSVDPKQGQWIEYGLWSACFWRVFTEIWTRSAELLQGKNADRSRHGQILAYEAVHLHLQDAFKHPSDRLSPRWVSETDFQVVYDLVEPDLLDTHALLHATFQREIKSINDWSINAHVDRALPIVRPCTLIKPNARFSFVTAFRLSRGRYLSDRLPFAANLLDQLDIQDRSSKLQTPGWLVLDLPKQLLQVELLEEGQRREVRVESVEHGQKVGIMFIWTIGDSARELYLPLVVARILSEIQYEKSHGKALGILVHLLERRNPSAAAALPQPSSKAQLNRWRKDLGSFRHSDQGLATISRWSSLLPGREVQVPQELEEMTSIELSEHIAELLVQLGGSD